MIATDQSPSRGRYHTRRLLRHKLFYDMQILTRKSCRKKGVAKVNDAQIW